ncbi:LysM peptidoglycan-binding domain-containing protein [Facklamia sp. DSM 111018]|uniref:LysM peptidoglycan-binding domain-containing protein n=1 Tax=Facklamia lactis TaxID=2749967 RepID=A0ABS0LN28_9LACT|nr:LysM peptidoglycan-binding domain-containing protein [Facklamia lactis]MBG9985566.1 LysM peptidoglycan-binding domain-containing protein [Facklamia lactis]
MQVGQELVVEAPADPEEPDKPEDPENPEDPEQPERETYVVQAGDSLWVIANKFGVSVNDLKEWNNLESNFIQIGQELIVSQV